MDPYRDARSLCPSCGRRLRVLNERLVCDACGGMLLPVAELAASIVDLGASALDVEPREATTRTCPRCGGAMPSAALVVDRKPLKVTVVACTHHGLWFDGGALERAYTEIGRRASRRAGRGRAITETPDSAGWFRYPIPKPPPGTLEPRPFRPRVRAAFASPLAAVPLACPACRGRLQLRGMLWTCDDHGVFVEHDVLAAMVAEMTNAPWEPPPWLGEAGARGCPACGDAMTTGELARVAVERCAVHGTWLSAADLEVVLARIGAPPPKGWLRRWF
jgi:Zn-finger nucleic acid-binding protein